jgi:hypothetical protein
MSFYALLRNTCDITSTNPFIYIGCTARFITKFSVINFAPNTDVELCFHSPT